MSLFSDWPKCRLLVRETWATVEAKGAGGRGRHGHQSKGTRENEHPTSQHSAQSWHHRSLNQRSEGTRMSTVQRCRADRRGALKVRRRVLFGHSWLCLQPRHPTPLQPCGHSDTPAEMHVLRNAHVHETRTKVTLPHGQANTRRNTHHTPRDS